MEGLGAFARTFEAPYADDPVLGQVAELLHDLVGLSAAAAVLLRPGAEPLVRVHPPGSAGLAGIAALPGGIPLLAPSLAGRVVRVPDLEVLPAQRGPAGAEALQGCGVRALAGVPVHAQSRAVGALFLFSREPRGWSTEALTVAQALADLAGAYWAMAHAVRDTSLLAGQLQTALDSRVIVEQAKGVLATALEISVDEAFERIRRHARRGSVRLDQVSAAVVHRGLRP